MLLFRPGALCAICRGECKADDALRITRKDCSHPVYIHYRCLGDCPCRCAPGKSAADGFRVPVCTGDGLIPTVMAIVK
mgnify:CR=1 FL=1